MFTIDNDTAHREIKTLMRQGKNLDIRIDESFALVSTHAITGLQYMLTPDNWQWLLNYLQTGDYEDFGIFPSDTSKSFTAMEHLKEIGEVVYLKADYQTIARRLGNLEKRGVALKPGQTLKDLYEERCALYEKYADVTVDEHGLGTEETIGAVLRSLNLLSEL
jgi:hypothetical protein